MRFLHISDLHFNPNNQSASTELLLNNLPEFLKAKNIKVDNIFFTGDFIHAKYQKDNDINAINVVNYIKKIADSVGISNINQIHIVPGNHDIKSSDMRTKIVDKVRNYYTPQNGIFEKDDLKVLISGCSFFKRINKLLALDSVRNLTLSKVHTHKVFDSYSILYLNTAITCTGNNSDRNRIIIGTSYIIKELQEIHGNEPEKPIIVLAHHSMELFEIQEKKAVQAIFRKYNVILYLCGDSHKVWYNNIDGMLEVTMGCFLSTDGVQAAFCYGMLDNKISITSYKWDEFQWNWGEYTNFNELVIEEQKRFKIIKYSIEVCSKNKKDWIILTPKVELENKYRMSTGVVPIEDTVAAKYVNDYFYNLNINSTICDSDRFISNSYNLILLCGPYANKTSEWFYCGYEEKFSFRFIDLDQFEVNPCHLYDKRNNVYYGVKKQINCLIDYAWIGMYYIESLNQYIIVSWGIEPAGTLAGAKAIIDVLTNYKKYNIIGEFEALIKVKYYPKEELIEDYSFKTLPYNL